MADGPNIDLIVRRSEEIPSFYQAADEMGIHRLWFTEMLFSQGWMDGGRPDSFGVLPAAAAVMSRIRLGAAPMGDQASNSSLLSFAEETAGMDNLTGGRLSLGLSRGRWPGEGAGDDKRPRGAGRLRETITVLKSLWSENEVTFKGSHFHLERASIDVRPAQDGGIPILLGGATSAAVNLAATLADGWVHPSGGIPGGAARGCDMVRRLASIAGRDPNSLELGKIIYLAIDNNKGRARKRIAPLLQSFHRSYDVDTWCAFGPAAECAAFIRRFLDAGITTLMLCLVPPNVEHLERLHNEVLPLLK